MFTLHISPESICDGQCKRYIDVSCIFPHAVTTSLLRFVIENVSCMPSAVSVYSDSLDNFWSINKISTLLRGSEMLTFSQLRICRPPPLPSVNILLYILNWDRAEMFESLVWWAPVFVALPSIKYVGILYVIGWRCLLFSIVVGLFGYLLFEFNWLELLMVIYC